MWILLFVNSTAGIEEMMVIMIMMVMTKTMTSLILQGC